MKKIYKYVLGNKMLLPVGFNIIEVEKQNDRWCLWAEVNTETIEMVEVEFVVKPTGAEVLEGERHIKTFFENSFVWHIYMRFDRDKLVIAK